MLKVNINHSSSNLYVEKFIQCEYNFKWAVFFYSSAQIIFYKFILVFRLMQRACIYIIVIIN